MDAATVISFDRALVVKTALALDVPSLFLP